VSEEAPRVGGSPRDPFAARRVAVQARHMAMLADTARFRADDPDELVTASLACPLCLGSRQVCWEAALDDYDPSVECYCPACDERWRVYLAPHQALRLGLLHH
jgi:hypothetical protein